ncbi:MAG: hypothetical protein IT373_28065 [Polyangiaceae bacterium]|nr:hypothetical protein [Polyangiaceae bacterium]
MTTPDDAVEQALWERTVARPDEDAAHTAYLEHCVRAGQLPLAARRYRERRDALPVDDPSRAGLEKRLGAVALLAIRDLDARREARAVEPGRRRQAALLLLAVLVVAALAALVLTALLRS